MSPNEISNPIQATEASRGAGRWHATGDALDRSRYQRCGCRHDDAERRDEIHRLQGTG